LSSITDWIRRVFFPLILGPSFIYFLLLSQWLMFTGLLIRLLGVGLMIHSRGAKGSDAEVRSSLPALSISNPRPSQLLIEIYSPFESTSRSSCVRFSKESEEVSPPSLFRSPLKLESCTPTSVLLFPSSLNPIL